MSKWDKYEVKEQAPKSNRFEKYALPKKSPAKQIGGDIWEGLKNIYPAIGETIKNIPEQLGELGQFVKRRQDYRINPAPAIAANLFAGLAKGGEGALNIPSNIANYLASRDAISPEAAQTVPRKKEYDYASLLGIEKEPGSEFLQGVGSALPYIAVGEAGALSTIPRMGARSLGQGLFATSQNQNPITAAGMIPGIEIPLRVGGAITKPLVPNAITPSGYVAKNYRGPLTLEEIRENQRAAGDTQTPLGDVLSSPRLKQRFENQLIPATGSIGDEMLGAIERQVAQRGEQAVRGLGGANPADANQFIAEMLKAEKKKSKGIKNELYNKVAELAKAENLEIRTPSFSQLAREQVEAIADSDLLKKNPKFRAAYHKMIGFKDTSKDVVSPILNKQGKPMVSRTLFPEYSDVKIVATELSREGERLSKSLAPADQRIGAIYKRLAEAARNDIKEGIKNQGSPAIQEAFAKAEDFYKRDYMRFRDAEVHDILGKGKSTQKIIRDIVKPSALNDQFELIKKVQDILPQSEQNALMKGFLESARSKKGRLRPQALNKKINALGNRQFQSLVGRQMNRQELLDFQNLAHMNSEALNRMVNPKTGARSSEKRHLLPKIVTVSTLGASKIIEPAIANAMIKALTSPKFRNKVIDKIEKAEKRKSANVWRDEE